MEWRPAVVGLLVLGVALVGLLFVLEVGPFAPTPLQQARGVKKFLSVRAVDAQDNDGIVKSGAVLSLSFQAMRYGTAPVVRWKYACQADSPVWISVVESTSINPYSWTIPSSLYGSILLEVSSIHNAALRQITSVITVIPQLTLSPPATGTWHDEGWVEAGVSQLLTYTAGDPRWLRPGQVRLEYATSDDEFATWSTAVTAERVLVDTGQHTVEWVPSADLVAFNLIKVRLVTLFQDTTLTCGVPQAFSVMATAAHTTGLGTLTAAYANAKITATLAASATVTATRWFYRTQKAQAWKEVPVIQPVPVTAAGVAGIVWPLALVGLVSLRVAASTATVATVGTLALALYAEWSLVAGHWLTSEYGDTVVLPATTLHYATLEGVPQDRTATWSLQIYDYSATAELQDLTRWDVGWMYQAEGRLWGGMEVKAVAATPRGGNITWVELTVLDRGHQYVGKTLPFLVRFRGPGGDTLTYTSDRKWKLALLAVAA